MNNQMSLNNSHIESASSHQEYDENADVLFEVGEVIKLKGGNFKIHSIGKKFVILHPLAGTSWVKR